LRHDAGRLHFIRNDTLLHEMSLETRIVRSLGISLAFVVFPALAQEVVIEVDAGKPANYRIPRTIFGTFLEPIGNSTYGGLWAELLENPSFEGGLWSGSQLKSKFDANPALYRASELGLPVPWEPLDQAQGARYEPRWNDAVNSYRSLVIMALPDRETGVRQAVYLPVHRTLEYQCDLHIKHLTGPPAITLSFRKRNEPATVLASMAVDAPAESWTKYHATLRLKSGDVRPLEPVDFVISASNGTRWMVDQVLLWPSDAKDGMDPEMIDLSKALRTPILRFGGNYTSAYHWRDGIGPMDKRISMLNIAWGIPEYNQLGTDEFLDFCRLIGAEPQIALNLGTGTPEEAAGWVDYVNRKWNGGKGGLTWELGNELWGDFQTGYPTLSRIARLTHDFAAAVRQTDPQARLIATGQDPDHFEKWNAEELKNAGLIDFLSTHFVVGPADTREKNPSKDSVAMAAFALPVELERRLRAMHDQINTVPEARDRVGIAFTEWLFWARDDAVPRYSNLGGGICAAGMLNTLMRTGDFVRISDMTGLIEFGGIWKKRGRVFATPAYWVLRMYSTSAADIPLEVRSNSPTYDVTNGNVRLPDIPRVPWLDVFAARSEDGGRVTLYCVNRDWKRDLTARIELRGFHPGPQARVVTLAGDSIYQVNDETNPEAVRPAESSVETNAALAHTFRRASVTVLEFRK
jgi:alpha-N-arabinofuranosidase